MGRPQEWKAKPPGFHFQLYFFGLSSQANRLIAGSQLIYELNRYKVYTSWWHNQQRSAD